MEDYFFFYSIFMCHIILPLEKKTTERCFEDVFFSLCHVFEYPYVKITFCYLMQQLRN